MGIAPSNLSISQSEVLPLLRNQTLQDWLGVESGKSVHATILFTDIVDSTKLNDRLGDAKWIPLLDRHLEWGSTLLSQKRGFKIKFTGDGFMAVFKNPMDALKFAKAFYKRTGHSWIKIRVSIHCGVCRVKDNDIYGTEVNYAARIIQWKKDHGIVVSDSAHRALKCHYGQRRGKELFIRKSGVKLRSFSTCCLYVVDRHERWAKKFIDAVPDVAEAVNARCAEGSRIRAAEKEDIDWIADLERRIYGPRLAVPAEFLHDWYDANPNGFSVLCCSDGELIGHLDILPLKPAGEKLLCDGRENEQAITADMIYSPAEQDKTVAFYVESIVIKDKYKKLEPRGLYCILNNFESIVNRVCKFQASKRIYGLGGTPSGEHLMRQLGFHMVGRADERADGYPLYFAHYCDIQNRITTLLKKGLDKRE